MAEQKTIKIQTQLTTDPEQNSSLPIFCLLEFSIVTFQFILLINCQSVHVSIFQYFLSVYLSG